MRRGGQIRGSRNGDIVPTAAERERGVGGGGGRGGGVRRELGGGGVQREVLINRSAEQYCLWSMELLFK